MKLEMTGGFLALLALGVLFGGFRAMAALGLAAAVHEWGHLAVLAAQGCSLRGLRLDASGLCIRYGADTGGYPARCLRALAGPAAGLALFGTLSCIARGSFLIFTARLSLALSLVNLLPVPGLDGGEALHSLLAPALGLAAAERAVRVAGLCSVPVCLALGVLASPRLAVFGLWLLLGLARAQSRD